ncbi:MAG: UDP-N-acetylmuramoyl-L-alanyl-D-glutamate--2,6-diaminopimelate ligase [Deltaproteobacteria bacterium]|nr:MAG: UDP-N-acetylmuramoyl-L-alanyl-D-glutamate--2,6-diaminopimelate ligase [Deltaproteobacteria bacterium]
MKLTKILEGVEIESITGDTEKEIKGIAYHSKQVRKGFLFSAIRGLAVDGHLFVDEAIEQGASAVILERARETGVTTVLVPNSRKALARASANYYGDPSSQVTLIGITGTNGKTTTAYLLESILKAAGFRVGVIGTINTRYGRKETPSPNTTPESLDLQRILREMAGEGVTHAIMEVSSHGLDLDRVFACHFDGAAFTNFTSDHLDYHHTLEDYFKGKRKLFSEVLAKSRKARRFAVTNDDDPKGEAMVEGIDVPILRYGLNSSSPISADQVRSTFEGLSCRIRTPKGAFSIQSKLIGRYNLYNILAAVATGMGIGLPLSMLKTGVEALAGVSGRFEKIENPRGIHIVVDYAHTQDALERILLGLRSILSGRNGEGEASDKREGERKIITVFGCGGDRDRTKRPLMGEVAGRYSDLSVLTSDNPRTEDPLAIMKEVEAGLKSLCLNEWSRNGMRSWRAERGYLSIPDRREAIRMAIRLAQPSDIVLIAGKGHEDYQIIGKEKFPFDDRVEARKALEEL